MANARTDKQGWLRCPNCGRKLGRIVGQWEGGTALPAIETKCQSCKTIVYIMIGNQKEES